MHLLRFIQLASKNKVKWVFEALFNIRAHEFGIVQLSFVYLTVISVFYTLSATVGDTLFLSSFGVEGSTKFLPWTYIATAVATVLAMIIYDLLQAKFNKTRLIVVTELILASSIFLFYKLISLDYLWCFFLLAIWLEVCALISITLYFSFIGEYFTSRDARRLYGYIVGGLPLGTFAAGYMVEWLLTLISPEDLLLICGGLLAVVAFQPTIISRNFMRVDTIEEEDPKIEKDTIPLKVMLSQPYVLLIFLMTLANLFCFVLVDFQMKIMANQVLAKEELAVFFGNFWAYVGFMQIFVQFVLVGWLLKRLGILNSLMIDPIFILLGSIGFFIHPTLRIAAGVKFARAVIFDTLDLPARELLFFPLSKRLRERVQALTVGVCGPLGLGLGGLMLVLLVSLISDIKLLSPITFGFSIIWLLCIIKLKPMYKKTLQKSIQGWQLDPVDLQKIISKSDGAKIINDLLKSGEPEAVPFIFSLITKKNFHFYQDTVLSLATSENDSIAATALRLLTRIGDRDHVSIVRNSLSDQRPSVRSQAILAYAEMVGHDALDELKMHILDSEQEVRIATLVGLVRHGGMDSHLLVYPYIKTRLEDGKAQSKIEAIQTISGIGGLRSGKIIQFFLRDSDKAVRREALMACMRVKDPSLVPDLVGQLSSTGMRSEAIRAIRAMPRAAVPSIIEQLNRKDLIMPDRLVLVQALAGIGGQPAIDALQDAACRTGDIIVSMTAAKSASCLIERDEGVEVDSKQIGERKNELLEEIAVVIKAREECGGRDDFVSQLFFDHARLQFELLLSLLFLLYRDKRIQTIETSLFGNNESLKANGLELLEIVMSAGDMKAISPVLNPLVYPQAPEGKHLNEATIQRLQKLDSWVRRITAYYRMLSNRKPGEIGEGIMENENAEVLKSMSNISFLKGVDLFRDIPSNFLASIAELVQEKMYYTGETIFSQGEVGDAFYLIREGVISIEVEAGQLAELGRGAAIGAMALIDGEPRSASAVVKKDARLLCISSIDFNRLLSTQPTITLTLLRIFSKQLREADKKIEEMTGDDSG